VGRVISRARIVRTLGLTVVVLLPSAIFVFLGAAFFYAQRADYGWSPAVARRAFTVDHPTVVIDEAHNNGSTAAFWGRYWPLARLLRAEGYAVERGRASFTAATLARIRVLIVANASGAPRPQIFGINVPVRTTHARSDEAFTPEEIVAVRDWIAHGGSLLLVADHAPFGEAAAAMAAAFGVTMHKGFVEVPGERSDPLIFSSENRRLGSHEIITGAGAAPRRVGRVMSYTGQSLDGPSDATVLLRLPPNAIEEVPVGDGFVEHPAGSAQGLALDFGAGRVVVLGEGAMITAQVDHRVPFGMNTGDNDNALFVLNVVGWLAR
jgi:hypothetical protein